MHLNYTINCKSNTYKNLTSKKSVEKVRRNFLFDYDAFGNRIAKHVSINGLLDKSTYYIHDANGNVISVYEHEVNGMEASYSVKERYFYGASRIGSLNESINLLDVFVPSSLTTHTLGLKNYQLIGNTGSVMSVISDKTIPVDNDDDLLVDERQVEILSSVDYSPAGVPLDNRNFYSSTMRFGFGSHEQDNEISGDGNHLSFGDYGLDTRLNRRWMRDPLFQDFPWQSPYVAFDNNPIYYSDPRGLAAESNQEESSAPKTDNQNPPPGKWMPEVTATGNRSVWQNVKSVLRSGVEQVGTAIRNFENQLKGNSFWTFGIEFKTKDGIHNGNTANPVKLKNAGSVLTLSWDDISDLTELFGSIGQEKSRKDFKEQSEDLLTDEQNKGKNWDETENRGNKPAIKKVDADTIWTNDGGFLAGGNSKPANPTQNKKNRKIYYKKYGAPKK